MVYRDKILDSIAKKYFDTLCIEDKDILLVALSGGMDSMCLIDVFCKLQSEVNYKIVAIHVHHGIRGKEADRDLLFVEKYCRAMGIKLFVERVDAIEFSKAKGYTIEEAARTLRYDAIDRCRKKLLKNDIMARVYVLTAHHESDQVETVIHNMLRGTGIKGIAGMREKGGYVLRPFLYIKKSEIEEYAKKNGIVYVEDSTNDDIKYTRNFIRSELLEKFIKINKEAFAHIAELSANAREIDDYLVKQSKNIYDKIVIDKTKDRIIIDLEKFRKIDKIIKSYVIMEVFNGLVNTLKDISKINVSDIIDLSEKEKGGHLDLPYNITIDKKQSRLIFNKNDINVSMSRRKKR